MLIKLISEDLASFGKKVLIIDNSPTLSAFSRMYNLFDLAGVDAIRPLIKGEILDAEQLNSVIVTLDANLELDYLTNSEIDPLDDTELLYITALIEKEYDYILVENNTLLTSKQFSIENIFITRPCEYVLKDKQNYDKYDHLVINKYNKAFNINAKKLDAILFNYDPDIVMAENGYTVQLHSETKNCIRNLTNTIIGLQLADVLFEESNPKRSFKIFPRRKQPERSIE